MAEPQSRTRNLVTVLSMMVLIGTEIFAIAFAAGWAIAGLFELGPVFGYVLMALFSALGVYLLLALWRSAVRVEPVT